MFEAIKQWSKRNRKGKVCGMDLYIYIFLRRDRKGYSKENIVNQIAGAMD